MEREWYVHSPDPSQISNLVNTLGCHQIVAAVLVNRGFGSPDLAARFLRPSLSHIRSPFLMKHMNRAVSRIVLALRRREKVLIFGDYDVDGMTATALLMEFLSHTGMNVHYCIPNRLTEGYGLSPKAVQNQAIARDISLIITVDCGITSHEAIRAARRAGIDVIITDHHEVPPELPDAFAILNPKQPDCPSPFAHLAGVGVAFNLVLALRKYLRDEGFWDRQSEPNLKAVCDLVALGTVADMVPILDENRIYVKAGLDVLATSPRPGVKALLEVCEVTDRSLDTSDIAFRLAPRLNVAGRLRHASIGCDLLTTSSEETARAIAAELDRENRKRQHMERNILTDIAHRIEADPQLLGKSLVLDGHGWHEGVIGIVASKLVDRYIRPVVLIAVTDGIGKGSARSPEGFDLFEALKSCAQYLKNFGGHEFAAGLTLKAENIPAFRTYFNKLVREKTKPQDLLPKLRIDAEIQLPEISPKLANELEHLAPFGKENPEPLFTASDVKVVSARTVGGSHVRMLLRPSMPPRAKTVEAILFNMGTDTALPGHFRRIACHVRWNRWNNRGIVQLVIRKFVPG